MDFLYEYENSFELYLILSYMCDMLVLWKALNGTHRHGTLQLGSGVEKTMIIGGGGEGGHHQVFQHPWAPPADCDLITIPGTDDLGIGKQLDSGGQELISGEEGLEEDVANPQQGGGAAVGVRPLFKCCGTGSTGGTALQN